MKLNLGCCDRSLPGFIGVDKVECVGHTHVITDLDLDWPWPDSSVSQIAAYDVVEHLKDIVHTMNEAWRVLRPGGLLIIIVPTTDGRGAWQDPTHVSFWNRNTFFYFTAGVPERERFDHMATYGVKARFCVLSELEEDLPNKVRKLTMRLAAVKSGY